VNLLAILVVALANNLDNTGVGIALGIARIRLSALVNGWVSMVTFVITGAAVAGGNHLASYLPLAQAHLLGGIFFCALGLWMVLPALRRRDEPAVPSEPVGPMSLHRLLANPVAADQNRSHDIDLREATLLAIALSLNNIGGGFSAGLVHLSALATAVGSAVISYLVLWFGGWAGGQVGARQLGKHAPAIAGALFLVIGLYQFR
jgi:putative sporulation protein YtaF